MSESSNSPVGEWIASELAQEDPDFVDLVEEFVESLEGRLQDLQLALAGQDLAQLRSLAHQLKGSGGGHGYPILTEKAAALEQQAVAGDVSAMEASVAELTDLISRVVILPPE